MSLVGYYGDTTSPCPLQEELMAYRVPGTGQALGRWVLPRPGGLDPGAVEAEEYQKVASPGARRSPIGGGTHLLGLDKSAGGSLGTLQAHWS